MMRSFTLPLASPLATAAGSIAEREGFLFARDGGVGEATPLPGWTESRADCERALRWADAADTWDDALAACEDAPAARHAVSLATLDAEARSAGVSLSEHLSGAAPADAVPVNATVGDADATETAGAVTDAGEAGFETVKVKVGARSVAADVDRLRAARDALDDATGGTVTLRADANGAWSREQAHEAFEALADVGVEYVEQPLPPDDLDGHRTLGGSDVGVALDESLVAHAPTDVFDAADYVVLKPMALGGVDRARDVALAARDAGVTPVVTTTIDAVVARTAAVHLAASIPDVPACGLATADRLASDLAADPAPVEDGQIRVPNGPGHGVSGVLPDA
jgi:o-succinylbenzoate synthase